MRKFLVLVSMALLTFVSAIAQTRQITGKVTDNRGEPVTGATVTIKGATSGTSADAEGNFRINAKTGDILVVSALQFGSKEVRVGNQNFVSVSLIREASVIDEVVVTSVGVQRQRKELGYSTARVSSGELTQAKPVNIATGLTGKVSGLNVTTINNGVFADVKINLRGIRSLTGDNNPMLLLDGVQTPIGYLSSLNPNDVQDVTILKGTSGAAIYGPDGRNGVIVVTTKKGTRDGRPVITLSHTTQFEKVAFLPKFQTRFGSGSSVDQYGNGVYDPIENQQYGPEFDGSIVNLGPPLEGGLQQTTTYSAKPDEKKKFWNTGTTFQTDLSLAAQNFYMSVQDVKVNGVVPKDENRRTSVRFNSAREYGRFKAAFNLGYIQQNYNIANQGANEWGPIQWLVFNTPMHVPLTSYKNYQDNVYGQFSNYFNEYYPNPYIVIDNYRSMGRNEDLLANTELNFKVTDWLNLTHRAAYNAAFNNSKNTNAAQFITPYAFDHRDHTLYKDRQASVSDGLSKGSRISSEFFASINKRFSDFRLNAIVGHYYRQNDSKNMSVSGTNLVVPTLFNVSNKTGELGGGESNARTRLMSVFGSVGLSYKGWANIEFTGRNDWTSVLSPDNNSYFYPGVNASVVLSDAISGLKNSSTFSYLKVRGSWNKTGSVNVGAYQLASTYSQAGGFPYGNLAGFTANNTALNPDLQPEFITNKEVGFELGLLKNRVNIEFAAYEQDNTDQIISIGTSSATGYTSSLVNAASFTNKGIEIDLRLTPIVKFRKGNVEFRTNFSINDSKVDKLYQGVNELFIGGFTGGSQAANYAIVGYPAFVFKGLDYVRDPEGRVVVDATSGYPSIDPNQKIFGRSLPKYIWGMTPTVNWNGLSLSIVAEYRGGHYAYHGIGPDMDFAGISVRSARNGRNRFVFPNSSYYDGTKYVPNTNITVANGGYNFYTSNAYNRNVATNYLTSAASWRIREVSLGFDIPNSVFGRQNVIKRATLQLNARNLFIWLPKSNEWTDPDFNFTSGNAAGVNTSSIAPPTRIFGANLTLTF